MCVFCNNQPRCRKCGDYIENLPLTFDESIEDEAIARGILAQNDVCANCKLDEITAADNSKLAFYKSVGMRLTAINN